jgi:hypothetical protein
VSAPIIPAIPFLDSAHVRAEAERMVGRYQSITPEVREALILVFVAGASCGAAQVAKPLFEEIRRLRDHAPIAGAFMRHN